MIESFENKVPRIAESAWVAESALVVGDVTLGKHVSIWPGSVVRGDTAPITIGDRTNIQDNCVVHGDSGTTVEIGGSVTVGHGAIIHCASVGDNSLVGIGATLLGGARIGKGCIIAAGALVRENSEAADGTFWAGVPAVYKAPVKPELVDPVAGRASQYVELADRHRRSRL